MPVPDQAPNAALAPDPAPPLTATTAPTAEPTKSKPVVLATDSPLVRFVVPAEVDEDGKPKGADLVITHAGVPLGKRQAAELEVTAAHLGVRLIDVTDLTDRVDAMKLLADTPKKD